MPSALAKIMAVIVGVVGFVSGGPAHDAGPAARPASVPTIPGFWTPARRAEARHVYATRPTGEWVAVGRVLSATRVDGRHVGEVLRRRWRFETVCTGGDCRYYLLRTSSTGIESSVVRFMPHTLLAEFGNFGTTCETRPGWSWSFSVTFSIWWTKHRSQLVAEEMGGLEGRPGCPYAGERIRWTAHRRYGNSSEGAEEVL